MIYYESNELYHHGILGQRWGKKNGPPYPLGASDHSASEKKAGWRKSLNSDPEFQEKKARLSQTRKEYRKSFNKAYNRSIGAYSPIKSHREANAERWNDVSKKEQAYVDARKDYQEYKKAYKNGGLALNKNVKSDEDFNRELLKKNPNAAVVDPNILDWAKAHKKQIAIGLGAAATVAIGAGVYKHYQNAQIDAFEQKMMDLNKYAMHTPVAELNKSSGKYHGFDTKSERFMKAWFHADLHRYDAISPEDFAKMGTNDGVVLKAGAKMFRMSKGEHNTLRSGFEYVSFDPSDRERYKGFLPQMWNAKSWNFNVDKTKSYFEAELSAKTVIKAPGKKESIELMQKALKSAYPGHSDEVYFNDVLRNFYRYQGNLIDRGNPLTRAYAKALKEAGYNAMIDFNDAGRLANTPLILINGAGSASVEKVNRYTLEETLKAFRNIEVPNAYKDFSKDIWNGMANMARMNYENMLGAYMRGA